MNNIPIVTLTVKGMEHQVYAALQKHEAEIADEMQKAVKEVCTEENIRLIIRKETADTLRSAVAREVDYFFKYGDGQQAIRKAVNRALEPLVAEKEKAT